MEADETISSNPSVYLGSEAGSAAFKKAVYDKREEESNIHHPFQRTPVPSCVKSDRSMAEPPNFSDKAEHFQPRFVLLSIHSYKRTSVHMCR